MRKWSKTARYRKLLSRLERKAAKAWKQARREAQQLERRIHPYRAYIGLLIVTIGVAAGALDRMRRQNTPVPTQEPSFLSSIFETGPKEAPVEDPLSASPWSFFHPVWDTSSRPSLLPKTQQSLRPELPVNVAALLDDPDNRVEDEFSVAPFMRDRVHFWLQVHAVYNSRMRIVHDRVNPAIIYGYLDFRPLFRVMGSGIPTEVRANQIEKQVLKELKARLSEATDLTQTSLLGTDEKTSLREFLSRFGALGAEQTAKLIANLRTQTGQSDEFLSALHRSRHMLPHIETVFRRQGLPVALGRIPFVESSFNPKASSKVGATGMWQFMPDTARQMISADPTKWSDPLRQTQAATKLLKIFRGLLPDWSTAVTSYNSGVGRLQRLVRKHRARNLEPILSSAEDDGLGFAGKNFYAQFLSANLVEAYKEQIFNRLLDPADAVLVLKGLDPFPLEKCDL